MNIGNERHFSIPNESDYNPESNFCKKSFTGPKHIDTATMSNMIEADDKNSTGEYVVEIMIENFDDFSR